MDRKTKGIIGEEIAQSFYEENGFEILEKNYRYKRAEIDIIALEKGELLVFVEVKSRNRRDYGEPETFVSEAQERRIKEAAEDYIHAINWVKDIRFDILCVDSNKNVEHFADAF